MYRVVIVGDDSMASLLGHTFVERDVRFQVVQPFQNGRTALAWLEQDPADPVVLDVYMSLFIGLELLHALRGQGVGIDAITVTAADDAPTADTLLKLGMVGYLAKPFIYERFQQTLGNFCRHRDVVAGGAVEQSVLDRLLSPVLLAEHQPPKSLQENILGLVRAYLQVAPPQGLPSEALSRQIGFSVVTVRRYVSYLVERGETASAISYDTDGHPCRLYHYPGPPAWTPPPSMVHASVGSACAIGLFRPRSSSPEQKDKVQIPEPGSR